ncbi:MAG: O-antigen ligase family protein [Elusimicrobia bacterium]|nr:O-antigen ligase family protein [Elusimicrobiota bacterium]
MADIKNNFFITAFLLAVVMVVSIVSKFSLVYSIQIAIFLILLTSTLFLLNNYKSKLNSYILPSAALLIVCYISYANADFQVNTRDYTFVLVSALFAGFNMTFLPLDMKKKIFFVPLFIALWLAMMLFSRFVANPQSFLTVDNFYDAVALNINVIAGFLVLVYPLFFVFIKEKKNQNVFTVIMIFVLMAIVITRCRVAIAVAFLLTLIFLLQYRKNNYIKILICLFGLLLVASIGYISFLKSDFNSLAERIVWWKTAYIIFKQNIFFGCGLGNYAVLFKTFRPELVLNTLFAHNIIMQFLADTGIVGLLSFIALIASFYIKVIDRIIEENDNYFYIVIALSITAFLIVNLIDYSFFVPANMLMFFVIMCSVFDAEPVKRTKQKMSVYILAVLVLYIGAVTIKPVIGHIHYKKGIEYYIQDQYRLAIEEFEEAAKYDPKNPEYYTQLGKGYFALYDMVRGDKGQEYADKSIAYNKKALELYKNSSQIRSYLASTYWNMGKKEEAIHYIKEAIVYDRFNPNLEEYLQMIEKNELTAES